MNYFFIGFTTLFIAALILYTVFYFKKFNIAAKVFECIQLPLIIADIISILIYRIPDSHHIVKYLLVALLFGTISVILFQFDKKNCFVFSQISLCFSLVIFDWLISSIFVLYHISTWIILPDLLILTAIIVFIIVFSKKQKYYFYGALIIPVSLSILFLTCAFFNLIAYRTLSAVIIFISAITGILLIIFDTLNFTNFKIKASPFIIHIALITTYALASSGFVLMNI